MVRITPEYSRRIAGTFGDRGRNWLDTLPETIKEYAARWGLRGLEPVGAPSYGWVAFCTAADGPAVLKLSVPNPEATTEVLALLRFPPSVACRVRAEDRKNGAVLLERLQPGTSLRQRPEFPSRVKIAAKVFAALHEKHIPAETSLFPRYADQARRAFGVAREVLAYHPAASPDLRSAVAAMIEAGAEALDRLADDECLIHGDLHHDNILQCDDGWKLVDPKGVIGPLSVEPARCIGNQIGDAPAAAFEPQLVDMCEAFAHSLTRVDRAVSPADVATGAVLDAVVSTCWSIEDGTEMEEVAGFVANALSLRAWWRKRFA